MKLCPQCEFIYEDDQSICDMDGRELVYDPGPLAFEGTVRFTSPDLHEPAPLPVSPLAGVPASQPIRGQSRGSAVAALAAIILVALLFVVYYARTLQLRSGNANPPSNQTSIQSASESTQLATTAEKPAPDLDSSLTASPEQSPAASPDVTTSSPSSLSSSPAASFSRARISSSPVSAGGSAAQNRGPVTVWLTNGASIKADEAWERREGIWYRQAGMVTFLRRSRVRSIQRLAAPNQRPQATVTIAEVKNSKPESVTAQNQPRAAMPESVTAQNQPRTAMPEPASTKKDSRVSSFLKKTGRILKKPFKF